MCGFLKTNLQLKLCLHRAEPMCRLLQLRAQLEHSERLHLKGLLFTPPRGLGVQARKNATLRKRKKPWIFCRCRVVFVAQQLPALKSRGMTCTVRAMIVLMGIPRITRMFLTKEEKPTRNIPGLWTCKLPKTSIWAALWRQEQQIQLLLQEAQRVSRYFSFPSSLKCTWSYQRA